MQRIVGSQFFIADIGWIVIEPLVFLAIPTHAQHLHASVRKLDHILLQRVETKNVLHLEISQLSIGPLRVDHVTVPIAKHPRSDTLIGKAGILKIAEHRFTGGSIHRSIVRRAVPAIERLLMTFRARCAANVRGRCIEWHGYQIIDQNADDAKEHNRQQNQKKYFFHRTFRRQEYPLSLYRLACARGCVGQVKVSDEGCPV